MKVQIIICLFLFFLALAIQPCVKYGTAETITITVNNTERIEQSKYLVFTDDETFQNVDTIWYFKWNSSDVQGKLKPNQTYKVKVYGWRIPFFSSYRNIVHVESL